MSKTCIINVDNGREVDLLNPQFVPEDLDWIAERLKHQPRFSGGIDWSVAQHSILVSHICVPARRWTEYHRNVINTALLHDASEALTGDMPKPLKDCIGAPFTNIEAGIERALAECFGLIYPFPDIVKRADTVAAIAEARHFFKQPPEWSIPPCDELLEHEAMHFICDSDEFQYDDDIREWLTLQPRSKTA